LQYNNFIDGKANSQNNRDCKDYNQDIFFHLFISKN